MLQIKDTVFYGKIENGKCKEISKEEIPEGTILKPIDNNIKIMSGKKVFKVAEIHELLGRVTNEEITFSRMVEIMNEMAYKSYKEPKLYSNNDILLGIISKNASRSNSM